MNSFSVNKIHIVGRIGKDAEWKSFDDSSDRGYWLFSVATDISWEAASGERQRRTTWHRCRWYVSKKSEKITNVLLRGALVYVEGKMEIQPREQGGVFASVDVSDFTVLRYPDVGKNEGVEELG